MEGQDWNEVKWNGGSVNYTPGEKKEPIIKYSDHANKQQKIEKKAEEGDLTTKKMDISFKIALQKARQAKNMTQKEFAQKLGVKVNDVNLYESGKLIPPGNIISKMNKTLGIKLPKVNKL